MVISPVRSVNVEVKVVVEVVVGGGEVVVEVVIEVIIMKNKKYLRVHQVEMPKTSRPVHSKFSHR